MSAASPTLDHRVLRVRNRDAKLRTGFTGLLRRLDDDEKVRLGKAIEAANAGVPETLTQALEQLALPEGHVRVIGGAGLGASISVDAGRAALLGLARDNRSTDWARSPLIGVGPLAATLHVSAATIANWRKARHVVAFRRDRRNYLYPLRQFVRGVPTPGLARVAAFFANAEEAWAWLVVPNPLTGGQSPLDRLQAGRLDEVAAAAEGALDFA